jgi:two-component system sensor histidine kinase KdpD
VLPVLLTALLVLGAAAASVHPSAAVETSLMTGLCAVAAFVAEARAAPLVALLGWLCATAFARAPYGELRPASADATRAAVAVSAASAVAAAVGVVARARRAPPDGRTLEVVRRPAVVGAEVDARRRLAALVLAAVLLPVLTAVLTASRSHLSLADDLLLYLVVVVAVAVVGGFWPAIAAAVAAALLLNWFFTLPLHTFTIARPDNLLALLLFIVVAVSVSSVVHAAARQAQLAARSNAEAQTLLEMARTVMSEDRPEHVLGLLHRTTGLGVTLVERVATTWTTISSVGDQAGPQLRLPVGDDLCLVVHGRVGHSDRRVLEAGAGLAAASLERNRLQAQAAQAETLAAGNRMRTALLAAVSHDLRTPLASIKAGITSLQQTDVDWSSDDETAFLETIAESTTRLESLIANLLDMSRVQSGALTPFVAPVSVDEVALLALRGLNDADRVAIDVPEDLPLVLTDGGLLERALANLVDNALRWSPPDRAPTLTAAATEGAVRIAVVDHGPGVDAADRERIFAPFQRLGDQDATTGVGLGLAVARGFVEAVGGSLVATETPGGGLTMIVGLPAAGQPVPPDTVVRP